MAKVERPFGTRMPQPLKPVRRKVCDLEVHGEERPEVAAVRVPVERVVPKLGHAAREDEEECDDGEVGLEPGTTEA